jgi:hypothetical protein
VIHAGILGSITLRPSALHDWHFKPSLPFLFLTGKEKNPKGMKCRTGKSPRDNKEIKDE